MTSGDRADEAPTEPLPEVPGAGVAGAPPPGAAAHEPVAEPADAPPEVGAEGPAEPPPASPLARALVLVGGALLLLAVGLLVTNALLTRSAENQAAERASETLDAPASVRLSGWPVGLRLATGQPVDAVVHASDVPIPGTSALLTRLEVSLDDVVVDRRALADGSRGLEAASGQFVAELDDDGVRQLAGLIGRLPLVGVELRSGVARLSVAGFPVLDATAEIDAGTVVFRPAAPIGSFARVQLQYDDLPLGFRADHVEIRRGVLRLEGSATGVRIG